MRKSIFAIFLAAITANSLAVNHIASGYPISQVPFTSVRLSPESFWGDRVKAAREVTIPLAFSKCESEGRYENFVKAAHPSEKYDVPSFMGFSFDDTDVYKTIEGASYVLQTFPDKKLEAYIDSILDIVAAAQEPDGYLYTARTINPGKPHQWSGNKRWVEEENLSHELYNLGHMVDAACAHYQATGSTKFLNIAQRYADCVCREVGEGDGKVCVVPGHQIAEMALVRLYVLTGEQRYLDEAKFLLDKRGYTKIRNSYSQSHKPILKQKEAVGHAVRAGYMYAGIADVAAITGDSAYIKTIDAIFNNIVGKKYYITGGVGAKHDGEAFGDNYELPNLTAYNETCAAISMVYLFHRMFLLHGDAKYIDCLERTLYNGVISGMAIDGGSFFYPNPLASCGGYERKAWFGCACCPSNLCRFIPSVPGYIYAVKDNTLYVNLFAANSATLNVEGKAVEITQTTEYPWNGDITLKINKTQAKHFALKIRIPGWAQNEVVPSDLYAYADSVSPEPYSLSVNGMSVDAAVKNGYATIERDWKKGDVVTLHLDMRPRFVKSHDKVTANHGRMAVECGPLVYCAEWCDNAFPIHGFVLNTTHLPYPSAPINICGTSIPAIKAEGTSLSFQSDGTVAASPATATLIPYFSWAHRSPGNMTVWLPTAPSFSE